MHHRRLLTLFLLLITTLSPLQAAEDFLKPAEAFPASAATVNGEKITVTWEIAPGYYLYKNKISFRSTTKGIESGEPQLPKAEIKDDQFFGEVEIYRGKLSVELPIKRPLKEQNQLTLIAKSQGCADKGLCYPPHEQTLTLNLPKLAAQKPAPLADIAPSPLPLSPLDSGGMEDDILPAEEAFKVSAQAVNGETIRLDWLVAPATYLYQDKFKISLKENDTATLADWQLPTPTIKKNAIRPDGSEGDLPVYDKNFSMELPLQRLNPAAGSVTLEIAYQGCAEIGICYPPQKRQFNLNLVAVEASLAKATKNTAIEEKAVIEDPVSEQDQIANMLKGGNTWWIVISFFGIGLLLAFTPCIFPMIPILSGIIAGQGDQITTRKAFMLSLIYVLAMAVTYTIAGVLAGLFGENLQAAFQNVWILSGFALVFVLLALSMFGFYELQLPSSMQSKLTEVSNKQKGGSYSGVAVMGFLSALIVGPCVAPPLAGALIYIGQTGDAVLGGLALFAMSMGMGAPLIALGTGAGKLLPRAGAWMDAVKAVFGVMLLGVAILLLERIIPAVVAMLLWGLLLIVSGVYMGALTSLADDASGWKKLWKGLGLSAVIYGTLMLVGVAANGNDTLQPLRGVSLGGGSGSSGQQAKHVSFKGIKSVDDLNRELATAKQQGKPVMLDFYADWCTYCIQFEKYVFTDAKVQQSMDNFILLQADVTANDEVDKKLLAHLEITAPPAIIFWDGSGKERRGFRVMGYMKAAPFNQHLEKLLR